MDGETPTRPTEAPEADPWQEYLRWARKFVEWDGWDDSERNYKLEIGDRLVDARIALLKGNSNWYELLERAIARNHNNLIDLHDSGPILRWCQNHPTDARSTLKIIWDKNRSVGERFNDFAEAAKAAGQKAQIAPASGLHMAMGPTEFPVFGATRVKKSYELTGYSDNTTDLGARYEHYLAFLDEMMDQAEAAGVKLRDRLDAQSVIWSISSKESLPNATAEEQVAFDRYRGKSRKDDASQGATAPAPDPATNADRSASSTDDRESALGPAVYIQPSFSAISAATAKTGLRISARILRRYHLSLSSRGFVILAGISGSGKTWLAEAYAEAIGAEHELIAIAPNWTTNEDLLGFYNPVTNRYHDTPFSTFIRRAADTWNAANGDESVARPYHIILDEMNLARVEDYFASFLSAMEVRARHGVATMDIGGGDKLELTPNLYVIGTVNIDETTHGFADKVWDRAQLVELDLPREQMAAHLSGKPYTDDVMAIWNAVRAVGPFAYRVTDDIAAYVSAAEAMGVTWQEALDEQVLQKILPKLRGTKPEVVPALEQLAEILKDRYPLSHARAQQMLEGIHQYGFASYFG